MPLYDYECPKCGKIFESFNCINDRNKQLCECGEKANLTITCHGLDWFQPHWNENFDTKPIYVRSKSHLKQLCKQYNVYCKAL